MKHGPGTITQNLRTEGYELHQLGSTTLAQPAALTKRKEGICLRDPPPAPSKSPKEVYEEISRQEESNTTTLASVGAVYHRQSEKIRLFRLGPPGPGGGPGGGVPASGDRSRENECNVGGWSWLRLRHAEPLDSLGLNGAGDDPADEFTSTGGEDI
ncbi:hypothetical protein F511_24375 [Dorcoceras hygrometricum]|uniref:Uncharacterized protein n=1 Tax=Dorcoceras hygrometricum TaxID=472368 RepID=A0A2Z7ARP2_9LAMI|nr:hypothetical protein F511_24375 [Dorcoceras hygrometricum]